MNKLLSNIFDYIITDPNTILDVRNTKPVLNFNINQQLNIFTVDGNFSLQTNKSIKNNIYTLSNVVLSFVLTDNVINNPYRLECKIKDSSTIIIPDSINNNIFVVQSGFNYENITIKIFTINATYSYNDSSVIYAIQINGIPPITSNESFTEQSTETHNQSNQSNQEKEETGSMIGIIVVGIICIIVCIVVYMYRVKIREFFKVTSSFTENGEGTRSDGPNIKMNDSLYNSDGTRITGGISSSESSSSSELVSLFDN